ncbi:MAG: hypothetical protein AAGK04_14525, partial [Planctomycetota bacterium]
QLTTEVDLLSLGLLASHDARWLAALASADVDAATLDGFVTLTEATASTIAGTPNDSSASQIDGLLGELDASTAGAGWLVFRLGLHDATSARRTAGGVWASVAQQEIDHAVSNRLDSPLYEDQRASLVDLFESGSSPADATPLGRFRRVEVSSLLRNQAVSEAEALADTEHRVDAASAWLRVAFLRHASGLRVRAGDAARRAGELAGSVAAPSARSAVVAYAASHLIDLIEWDDRDPVAARGEGLEEALTLLRARGAGG